jgi:hypothetical protein
LWTRPSRLAAIFLASFGSLALAAYTEFLDHWRFNVSDNLWYIRLASGDRHSVPQPFASRQLGAAVVHWIAAILHCSITSAFILQGTISLILVLIAVYALYVRTVAPRWLLLALAVVPFWAQLFNGLELPDIWYALLIAGFLWLLFRKQYILAALMMFPLMVSRESTSLTLLCFLLAAWRPLRWPGRILAVVAGFSGTMLVSHLTAGNPGNMERLPQSVYMLLKVPWNFLTNVLGVIPWSNIYPNFCSNVPSWTHPLHLGPVTVIGICGYLPIRPLYCLADGITVFGLLPLLTAFILWRLHRSQPPLVPRTAMFRFCLVYGGVSYLIAPVLGVAANRLFGYGWPLPLVALPLLFTELQSARLTPKRPAAAFLFFALHIATCLVGYAVADPVIAPYLIALEIALNLAGFLTLFRWWGPISSKPNSDTAIHAENPQKSPLPTAP